MGSLLVMKSSVLVVFLLSYKIQNKRLNRKIPNLEKLLLENNLIRKKNKNDFGRFEKNLIRKTLVSVGYCTVLLSIPSGAHKGRSVQRHSRVGRIIVGE